MAANAHQLGFALEIKSKIIQRVQPLLKELNSVTAKMAN